jgi:hypothetical protein
MAFSMKTPTLCERETRQLWGTNLMHPLARDVKDTLLTRKEVRILIIIGYYTLLYNYNFNPIKHSMVVIVFRNNENRQNEIQPN